MAVSGVDKPMGILWHVVYPEVFLVEGILQASVDRQVLLDNQHCPTATKETLVWLVQVPAEVRLVKY